MKPFHGVMLVDKPAGMTSHDVVAEIRSVLETKHCGHAGTLDPLATGLLVILVGEATKISDHILKNTKAYEFQLKFGENRDTDDSDGQVTNTRPVQFDPVQLTAEVAKMTGRLELRVPAFSSIRVQGRKLYDYARSGQSVELPLRPMVFGDVELVEARSDWALIRFSCSKGSYVRSWGRELGERLGCGAYVQTLRRLYSEPYNVEQAVSLETLKKAWNQELGMQNAANPILRESAIPLGKCLPGWRALNVAGLDERLLRNGQISHPLKIRLLTSSKGELPEMVKILRSEDGWLLSILKKHPDKKAYKISRVFPNPG